MGRVEAGHSGEDRGPAGSGRWEGTWEEEKGMTEDKMVGWHHLLNEDEFQ